MRFLILFLFSTQLFALSFFQEPVPKDVCTVSWIPSAQRIDGKSLSLDEIAYYQLFIDGVYQPNHTLTGTTHTWTSIRCPVCGEIQFKTVDTQLPPKISTLSIKGSCL